MLRVQSRGLGQQPIPSAGENVYFSPVIVDSQSKCAEKGGELFDDGRLCCVRMNPDGKPEPGRQSDYGWTCARTSFGVPSAPAQTPSYASMIPLPSSASSPFGISPTAILIGVGALLAGVILLRRQ